MEGVNISSSKNYDNQNVNWSTKPRMCSFVSSNPKLVIVICFFTSHKNSVLQSKKSMDSIGVIFLNRIFPNTLICSILSKYWAEFHMLESIQIWIPPKLEKLLQFQVDLFYYFSCDHGHQKCWFAFFNCFVENFV